MAADEERAAAGPARAAASRRCPGSAQALARRLARLGLRTVGDLLLHRPHRYEEAAPERPIRDLFGEEEVAIAGIVVRASSRRTARRLTVQNVRVRDDSGEIDAVWFNQPWVADRLHAGDGGAPAGLALAPRRLRREGLRRRRRARHGRLRAGLPGHRGRDAAAAAGARRGRARGRRRGSRTRSRPRSGRTRACPSAATPWSRSTGRATSTRPRRGADASPSTSCSCSSSRIARRAREREAAIAPSLGEPGELIRRYREALPFTLTPEQEAAVREVDADLARTVPMQRLLQGDVGSGKTVVALYALLRAVEHGRQGALMAPTETLAEQHFLTIEGLCAELGVRVVLLTSALRAKEHAAARDALASGEAQLAVGTHALIQEQVEFADLAVAVVDEQHRFGVEQRAALVEGRAPHVLHMTATPIPRTLALTVYGDLRVSEIARPPANRTPDRHAAGSPRRGPRRRTRACGGCSRRGARRTSCARSSRSPRRRARGRPSRRRSGCRAGSCAASGSAACTAA